MCDTCALLWVTRFSSHCGREFNSTDLNCKFLSILKKKSGICRGNEPVDRVADKRSRERVSISLCTAYASSWTGRLIRGIHSNKACGFHFIIGYLYWSGRDGGGGGKRRKLLSRQMRCHGDNNNISILMEANINVRAKGHLIIPRQHWDYDTWK